jgi:nicotinamide-nucleotide amidase
MNTEIKTIAQKVGLELKQHHLKLVTAESCTAGGLGYAITSIAGSSTWFDRGFITYSNSAKIGMLNVSNHTLRQHGAVSEATACEMAEGALRNSEANISIAITGIAGPDGGTPDKPVGTVWIAYAGKNLPTKAFVTIFSGDRETIREQSITVALKNILDYVSFPLP